VRNVVGLVLLAALSAVAFLEFWANRGYNEAVKSLDAHLAREDVEMLPQAEVEKRIGKAPDRPLEDQGDTWKAHYTWRGLVRSYPLEVIYTKQSPPHLLRLGGQVTVDTE
jgi:hypothetical protein